MVSGFDYEVLGGRVPTLIVSPRIEAGSRVHQDESPHFDHTSIIKTVWRLFDLTENMLTGPYALTARDAAAPSLLKYVQDEVVNDTAAFGGIILVSPGSLVFERSLSGLPPQTLLAATGDGTPLTATASVQKTNDKGESWLSVVPDASIPNAFTVAASDDHMILPELYEGSITISGEGYDSVTVTVGLNIIV